MKQYIYFNAPPSPYYLESGTAHYEVGDSHPNRSGLKLFDMIIVKQGCLYLGEEQKEWAVKEGEAIVLLPDSYHYSVKPVTSETFFYWVHFQTVNEWQQANLASMKYQAEQHQQCFNPKPYTIQISKYIKLTYPKQVYDLLEQMNSTHHLIEPKAYFQKQQAFESLLLLLDEHQHGQQTSQLVKLAEQVELYIRSHYKEAITNERLSAIFNYHYNYITRAMKKVFQYSPHEYVMKLRIDEAKILLLNTHHSISSIAQQIGFEHAPYFTNCFQKYVGVTPSTFRKQFSVTEHNYKRN